MKKVSAILLSLTLLLLAMVPFAASADDVTLTLTVGSATVDKDGVAQVPITFSNTAGYGIMEIQITVEYDPDQVEFIVPKNINGDAITGLMTEGNWQKVDGVDKPMTPGAVNIATIATGPIEATSGTLYNLQFQVLDAEYGDEFTITLTNVSATLADEDGNEVALTDVEIEVVDGVITVAEPTTAPTTEATTAAPTTGTKPNDTGDSTPWSLLAVAALASAGLVVMTMKRK